MVYDSILLNKQKTKSYWEQLMMAAAAPGSPTASPAAAPATPHGVPAVVPVVPAVTQATNVATVAPQGRDMPSLEQAGSEVSEQEYFDAQSTVSRIDSTILLLAR